MQAGCWIQVAKSNNDFFDNTLKDDVIIRSDIIDNKILISPLKVDGELATMAVSSRKVTITGNLIADGLDGVCISNSTNSTSSNIAASSLAVKTVMDYTTTTNIIANAALPKAGGTVTGDIILSGIGTQVLGDATINNVGNPSFSWSNDSNTGVYRVGAGSVGVTTGGVNRATIDSNGITTTGVFKSSLGTASLPSHTFSTDCNTGIYSGGTGSGVIGFSTKGVHKVAIDNSGLIVSGLIRADTITGACISTSTTSASTNIAASSSAVKSAWDLADAASNAATTANTTANAALPKAGGTVTGDITLSGAGLQILGDYLDTVALPSFSWSGDDNTGMYHIDADSIGFAAGGVKRATIDSTGLLVNGTINGTYLFGDCISSNINSTASNVAASSKAVKTTYDLAFAASNTANAALPKAGGTVTGDITINGVSKSSMGTMALPSRTFLNDSTTGIYSGGSSSGVIGFSSLGTSKATIHNTGMTVSGAVSATSITGSCISDSTSTTTGTVAASSTAVKLAWDLALAASNAATTVNTIANAALPKAGGTVTGDITLSGAGTQIFGDVINTVSAPTFSWSTETNTGIYRAGAGSVGVCTFGVNRATINDTGINVTGNTHFFGGGTGATSLILQDIASARWKLDTNAFNFNISNDSNGSYVSKLAISRGGDLTPSGRMYVNAGNMTLPAYSFEGDNNTGIYKPGSDCMGFSAGGVHKATIDNSGLIVTGLISADTISGACISTSTTSASTNIAASSSAVKSAWDLATTANTAANAALPKAGGTVTGGIYTTDIYSFSGDMGLAMYRESASVLAFKVAGTQITTIHGSGLAVVGAVSASSISGNCISSLTNVTSATTAASCTAVKSAWDLANAALPNAGGTITGTLNFSPGSNLHVNQTFGHLNIGAETAMRFYTDWNNNNTNNGFYEWYTKGMPDNTTTRIPTLLATLSETGNYSVLGNLKTGAGSAVTPAYSFGSDPGIGMYRVGGNTLGFSAAGVNRVTINTAGMIVSGILSVSETLNFYQNNTNFQICQSYGDINIGAETGMNFYTDWNANNPGMGNFRWYTKGHPNNTIIPTLLATLDEYGQFSLNGVFQAGSGSVTAPSYSFGSDKDTGMYKNGQDSIGITINSVNRFIVWQTSCTPGADNVSSLGTSAQRWTTLYSASGTINTSDDRIKTNEEFITNATDTLNKLRPQIYDKLDKIEGDVNKTVRESGLIAQEIFYDAPELRHIVHLPDDADKDALYSTTVTSSSDPAIDPDYSSWGSNLAGVNYTGLIPYLIKAMQEKDAQINILDTKYNDLLESMDLLKTQYNDVINRISILENK